MIDERWQAARRILVLRLDNLGDVLVTTPAIHAIKESLPEVHLTLLASPVGAQAGLLNPDIDEVIVYQAPWMDPWHRLPQDSEREQQMVATLKEGSFDGAIIFTSFRESSLPAAYLCYLAGIPLRLAASIDGPGSLLTTRHKHPERMMHEVERGLDLVGAIGLGTAERDLVLTVPECERAHAAAIRSELCGSDGRPLIVVHPGCSMPARTYPWEMFAEVADLLIERLGAVVVLTGSEDERELTARIRGLPSSPAPLPSGERGDSDQHASLEAPLSHDGRGAGGEGTQNLGRPKAIDYAGALPFGTFCALIEAADLTITNNTGPMHISAAVKTPVVALFALTNPPEQWGPWRVPHQQLYHDVPCRICYKRICPYGHECLRLVTPEMVIDAVCELLAPSLPAPLPPAGEGRRRHRMLESEFNLVYSPSPARGRGGQGGEGR